MVISTGQKILFPLKKEFEGGGRVPLGKANTELLGKCLSSTFCFCPFPWARLPCWINSFQDALCLYSSQNKCSISSKKWHQLHCPNVFHVNIYIQNYVKTRNMVKNSGYNSLYFINTVFSVKTTKYTFFTATEETVLGPPARRLSVLFEQWISLCCSRDFFSLWIRYQEKGEKLDVDAEFGRQMFDFLLHHILSI